MKMKGQVKSTGCNHGKKKPYPISRNATFSGKGQQVPQHMTHSGRSKQK